MAKEIERKYLVDMTQFDQLMPLGKQFIQAYAEFDGKWSDRVRIIDNKEAVYCTKSVTVGIERDEFESDIPVEEAFKLINNGFKDIIYKTRYLITVDDHIWELDVFEGLNRGLILAEIELDHAEEEFTRPAWAIQEVSDDSRYFNACLAKEPYSQW